MAVNAKLNAQFTRTEITSVFNAAVAVLGDSTLEYSECELSTEELASRLPEYCTGGGYMYSHAWLGLKTHVPMPVQFTKGMDWDAFASHQEEFRASVLEALQDMPVGGSFGYGWVANESTDCEVVKAGPDRWVERVTHDSQAESWEEDRAARRLPFQGCRKAIWEKAGLEGPANHQLLDAAIDAAMLA